MTVDDITVDLRLNMKADSIRKAFADVTIALGADGVMKLCGYSVFAKEGGSPWISPPGRKGTHAFFRAVQLMGRVESLVAERVLAEYRRKVGAPE